MDLVGAWVRQLLAAGMAAAIVPVAMLAALAVVLVGAGGLGGLGSLEQLIGGPQISPAEEAAPRQGRSTDVARVAPPTLVVSRAPVAKRRAAAPAREAPRPPPQARIQPAPPPLVGVAPPATLPQTPAAPAPPAPRQNPRERTQPVTKLLETTVEGVRAVVEKVIDRLGQTVEKIIGPPPLGR